jgi:hypothetical protein
MEKDSPKTISAKELLDEANSVRQQRGAIYGHPYENMRTTAQLVGAYLGFPVSPDQMAVILSLVKIARIAQTPGHRNKDSYLDGIAYLAIAAECSTTDPYEFDDSY